MAAENTEALQADGLAQAEPGQPDPRQPDQPVPEQPASEQPASGSPAEPGGTAPPGPAAEQPDVEVEGAEHAPTVEELDPETRARRDAALAVVRKFGDPVLRAAAVPVDRFDATLQREAERMGELMQDALGIGLAATQLGVLHRLLVFKAYEDDPVTVLVNPTVQWRSDELETAEEGCLSLPGVHVEVERPERVRVSASDAAGEPLQIEAEGLRARVIQHEIDHLDGVLILDRISREARKEAMRRMREVSQGAPDRPPPADAD